MSRYERRKKRTHQALLAAGLTAVASHGPDDLTIAQVTDTADVGLGTFYNHFADRAAFLEELWDMHFLLVDTDIDAVLGEHSTDPILRFAVAAGILVHQIRTDPMLASFTAHALGPEMEPDTHRAELVRETIRRGIEQGVFADRDVELSRRLTLGITRQFIRHHVETEPTEDAERLLIDCVLMVLGVPDTEREEGICRSMQMLDSWRENRR
ncbi:MAG TPA: TetR/AcrR family transcriptional regulator [Acidimicrobiales bacterium]|nr:TetR/AcrR family transcriptional regulator [Acidimicrobiales bacterium]